MSSPTSKFIDNLKVRGLGFRTPIFGIGLVLKLVLAATLASSYYADLFVPFVNQFVSSGFSDPYAYWVEAGREEMFPYPAMMLYIMSLPRVLLSFLFGEGHTINWLDLLVLRLPLLVCDVILLVILNSWLKGSQKQLLKVYWLSPLLIYISYIHGQLDIIPITMLFGAIYYQFREKYLWATLLLGLAIATKTNMVVALPFYIWFLYTKRFSLLHLAGQIGLIGAVFLLVNLPFLTSSGFWQMVFANREQGKIFNLRYDYGMGLAVFLLPAAYYLTVARSLAFKLYNRDLYVMFLGFAFGILVVLIPPMQGWYFWVLPFLIYFLIKQSDVQRAKWAFWALNSLFFTYFALVPQSDFLNVFQITAPQIAGLPNLSAHLTESGIATENLLSLVFTLMQVTLAVNVLLIYQYGINETLQHKIRYKPYLIGVGGDSGSGKSTFTTLMTKLFAEPNVSIVRGDDMHKWERGHEMWQKVTHLNPGANHLHNDLNHAMLLKRGRTIARRHYDHADGKFTLPIAIKSNRVVVIEGLHPFYLSHTRQLFDCKVFVNPDTDLRNHWKILRDTAKRGYSMEKIMDQIKAREADAERYIKVQAKYADIVISYANKLPMDRVGHADQLVELILNVTLENNVDLDRFLRLSTTLDGLSIKHLYIDEDHQQLVFDGQPSGADLTLLLPVLVPELEEISVKYPALEDGYNGLLQLLMAYYVFNKLELE